MKRQYSEKQLQHFIIIANLLGIFTLLLTFVFPIFILASIAAFIFAHKFKKLKSTFQTAEPIRSVPTNNGFSNTFKSKDYYKATYSSGINFCSRIYNSTEVPAKFVVIDFETTGLESATDRIIEVAIISCENGEIVDRYSQLIDPELKIPNHITQITRINNQMVKGCPKIYEVISDIYSRINGQVILGYNISFDINFLGTALSRNNMSINNVQTFDVLQLVKETIPSNATANRKLETIKGYYGIVNASHRALSDCEVTFEIFKKCNKVKENYELKRKAEQLERLEKLNDNERSFIIAVEQNLDSINLKDRLSYSVMADKNINFDIDNMQIGRIKLRGKSYKMQILDKDNVVWLDIENLDEAIINIKHWVKYCKYLIK